MAISKAELKNAFRESISNEFIAIPRDETKIDYEFSNRFEKKMSKLIQSEKKKLWPIYNTPYKRVALIVAILMCMFITACSVPVIREGIVNFFYEVFDTHNEYHFEGDLKKEITEEYYVSNVPDNFVKTAEYKDLTTVEYEYSRNEKETLLFSQCITETMGYFIDNEKCTHEQIATEEYNVDIYISPDYIGAIWVKDGYFFELTYFIGDNQETALTKEQIIEIIESVKVVE